MTRIELYHNKKKSFSLKGLFLFTLTFMIIAGGFFVFHHYYESTIKIEAPVVNLGKKIVIQLPNGQKVYTYENLIVVKDGKTFYKGERNKIDVTGGTITYEEWD